MVPPDAFDGDPSWRVERTLRDGRSITIRPILPTDREDLRRGFRETSAETRYLRFMGVFSDLSERMLTYLTCVDQKNHVALVATMASPDLKTERGVGIARFIRLESSPEVAEAAITVIDDMQKQGVGTALALELERAAQLRGIRVIRADVLEGNATMRSIIEQAGGRRVDSGDTPGMLTYDVPLEEAHPSKSLMDVLKGAATTMALSIRRFVPPHSSLGRAVSAAAAAEDDEAKRHERKP